MSGYTSSSIGGLMPSTYNNFLLRGEITQTPNAQTTACVKENSQVMNDFKHVPGEHNETTCKILAFLDLNKDLLKMKLNDNLTKENGLVYKIVDGYYNKEPSYFIKANEIGKGVSTTFTQAPSANVSKYSVEWVGIFIPPSDDVYTFMLKCDNQGMLWVGDDAISTYSSSKTFLSTNSNKYFVQKTKTMRKNELYQIRLQVGFMDNNVLDFQVYKGTSLSEPVTNQLYHFKQGDTIVNVPEVYYALSNKACYISKDNVNIRQANSSRFQESPVWETQQSLANKGNVLRIVNNNAVIIDATGKVVTQLSRVDDPSGTYELVLSSNKMRNANNYIVSLSMKSTDGTKSDKIYSSTIANAMSNNDWVNYLVPRKLKPNETLAAGQYIYSTDGAFKLYMSDEGKLKLVTNKMSMPTRQCNDVKIRRLTSKTYVPNNYFLTDVSNSTLTILPPDHPYFVRPTSMSDVTYSSYNGLSAPLSDTSHFKIMDKYQVDEDTCKKNCTNDSPGNECSGYYYNTRQSGGTCTLISDISSTRMSILTKDHVFHNPNERGNTKLMLKQKLTNKNDGILNKIIDLSIYEYNTNAPYDTYNIDKKNVDIYGKESFTTLFSHNQDMTGYSLYEGFKDCTANDVTDKVACMKEVDQEVRESQNALNRQFNQVITNYQQLRDTSNNIQALRNTLGSEKVYDFDPAHYTNEEPKTLKDAFKEDINEMLIQENNMYIMGTITAATLFIAGIMLSRP